MVHLVDYGHLQLALYPVGSGHFQVVAEKIEAKLPHGAINDYPPINVSTLLVHHIIQNSAHADAQRFVDGGKKVGVSGGQVIVGRDYVDRFALQCMEHRRERSGDCFALSGVHLNHAPLKQMEPGQKLLVRGTEPEQAFRVLAAHRLVKLGRQENVPDAPDFFLLGYRNQGGGNSASIGPQVSSNRLRQVSPVNQTIGLKDPSRRISVHLKVLLVEGIIEQLPYP